MKHIITAEEVAIYGRPVSTDKTILDSTINEVEAEEIRPRLGDALFVALTSDDETDRFNTLLEGGSWTDKAGRTRYCMGLKRAAAYFVYARVLRDGNIQATRYGAVNKNTEQSSEPVIAERRRMYEEFFATADRYLKDCLLYLADSTCSFPEYVQNAAMKSNRNAIRVVGSGTQPQTRKPAGVTVIAGAPGESAYETAVRLGYRGSEEDWIAALPYTMAVALGYRGTKEEWLATLPYLMAVYEGYTGTSSRWLASLPYQLAVSLGYEGTEQEWLDSLQASVTAQGVKDALGYTPADDAGVVKLEGNQTIHGLKSFSDGLRVDDPSAIRFMSQSQTLAQILAAIQGALGDINGKIPAAASPSNPLVDQQTLEESIAFNTGHYISKNGQPFSSVQELEDYPKSQLTNNDYAVVTGTDEEGHVTYTYYVYNSQGLTWAKEFVIDTFLNPFTPEQLAALNSGITAAILQALQTEKADKSDVNLIGRNVNYTDKMSDLAPDLHAIGQATSVINVLVRGRVEACILPTTEITRGWLYEYEEGWRLARVNGFTMTANSTWEQFLDFMDLEGNSAMLVGADYIGQLSALTTQNKTNIVEAINEVNAKVVPESPEQLKTNNLFASMVVDAPTVQTIASRETAGGAAIRDGVAYVKSLRGNSLKWNQLSSLDVPISKPANRYFAVGFAPLVSGHRYLVFISAEWSEEVSTYKIRLRTDSGPVRDIFSNTPSLRWHPEIVTAAHSETLSIYNDSDSAGVLTAFALHDLTAMGMEDITSADEFAQRLGYKDAASLPPFPYDAGSIRNFTADELTSKGRNIWDEEWELGTYGLNGAKITSNYYWRGMHPIKVSAGETLYFKNNTANQMLFVCYDASGAFVKRITLNDSAFSGTYVVESGISFIIPSAGGTGFYKAPNHDICINLSNPAINGQYFPYKENHFNTSFRDIVVDGVQVFPNGGCSAGSAFDELTESKATKRVGVVDLATISFNINADGNYYTSWDNFPGAVKDSGKVLSALYARFSHSATYLRILDATSSPMGFLYYELATPEDYAIAPRKMFYEVEAHGTESIDTDSAPLVAEIGYKTT